MRILLVLLGRAPDFAAILKAPPEIRDQFCQPVIVGTACLHDKSQHELRDTCHRATWIMFKARWLRSSTTTALHSIVDSMASREMLSGVANFGYTGLAIR